MPADHELEVVALLHAGKHDSRWAVCSRRCRSSLLRKGPCRLVLVQQHVLVSAHLAHVDLVSLSEPQALQGTTPPLNTVKLLLGMRSSLVSASSFDIMSEVPDQRHQTQVVALLRARGH